MSKSDHEIKFTLRMSPETAEKMDYIADYYGRSRNSEINWAARCYIKKFENEHGKVEFQDKSKHKA